MMLLKNPLPVNRGATTPLPARIFVGILVDPDPSYLDDPEVVSDRLLQRCHERLNGELEMPEGGLGRQAQDGDAREVCGVVAKRIAEFEIESDETPVFLPASLDDLIIAGRAEVLAVDRGDVVAGGFEKGQSTMAQVLVELELQRGLPSGTST